MSFVSPCFDTAEERRENRAKLMGLPLEDKVVYTKARIMEFYVQNGGRVYVSFSGGKDSTVLLDLVRSVYPEVPAVFVDTGLEFPEIREQVRKTDNVTWLKPEMSFRKVVQTYGYPCIGKNAAHWIDLAQRNQPSGIRQMSSDGRYGYARFAHMVDAPFRVSERCCDVMKKRPAKEYHNKTGRCPYIGTRADESRVRTDRWIEDGENRDGDIPTSNPLSIWTEKDIWTYIRTRNLPYADVYDRGYDRTGCVFCMFGITRDRNRFLKLKATHPELWEYCMKPVGGGGLGMKSVLEYMGIPTGCNQTSLTTIRRDGQ